jgi:alginate O-acetyltransferase complex protein AlgI
MLFHSYAFVIVFLPLSLLIYHGLRGAGLQRTSILALTLLSLFFYGWWNPIYLLLLAPLVLINFAIATRIAPRDAHHAAGSRTLLTLGIVMNVGVLGYFKYANFFVDNFNTLLGADLFLAQVLLPLGISFFTFQKIAFLVDAYRGKVERLDLLDFSLFVSFFPQLIAGPIVHHRELLPQFRQKDGVQYVMMGITFFAFGLVKKVLLADSAAAYATPQFDAVAAGVTLDLLGAWSAALAYTAQLYFDFSGYSDMAIGAALMFGIRLPVNFASPYKATSIIDFWQRWHITLSRFLRDYVYIPLGGNRRGVPRRYANLIFTMILGGFWHGAAWSFVIWGGLHASYLAVNHAWRAVRPRILSRPAGGLEVRLGQAITFVAVVVGWVFFRAADARCAMQMLSSMVGSNGIAAPASLHALLPGLPLAHTGIDSGAALAISLALLLVAWLAPNTQQMMNYSGPLEVQVAGRAFGVSSWLAWRPIPRMAVLTGCLLGIAIMSLSKVSEFLYFQF